ncbi:hypothetical protein Esi_0036_0141 [Ectocarpus siliculosus]|uniref:WW domain-containing protein n=1 Tax=Ectocarpus siliculosus TaxID=2880 RepID=D8LLF5_ECTSI|nr:hypothetical protein Esi_0036_0141 [Ectocarpus siliculosus]|eukprot:CBN77153.1 hypothetical protein Esi_0036_0141 [Ectocarpus siliculosus]
MEHVMSKFIKRRNRPSFEPKADKKETKKEETKKAEESSEDEEETEQQWEQRTDPYGRLCWQHRQTGQVTYGTSYALHQQGYNTGLAAKGFDSDDDDDDNKKPAAAAAAAAAPVPALAPVAVVPPPQPYMQQPQYGISPVPRQYYGHSPVPYGMSPVAMYPAAPWNAMPASPVPVQVPEYIKRQHAEALKAKKKKEEEEKKKKAAEKKKIAAGVWEKLYTRDGGKFWQHSVTGETSKTDPYY